MGKNKNKVATIDESKIAPHELEVKFNMKQMGFRRSDSLYHRDKLN